MLIIYSPTKIQQKLTSNNIIKKYHIRYYSLPFCQPSENFEKSESLGEALSGDRK